MRRAAMIGLAVMGGGLVLYGAHADHEQAERCRLARLQNLPDADQICARSQHHWYSGSSGYSSHSYSGSSSSSASSVSRGGFGAAGAHFASLGS